MITILRNISNSNDNDDIHSAITIPSHSRGLVYQQERTEQIINLH